MDMRSIINIDDSELGEFVRTVVEEMDTPDALREAAREVLDSALADLGLDDVDLTAIPTDDDIRDAAREVAEEVISEHSFVTEHDLPDLDDYVTRDDIPDVDDFVTTYRLEDAVGSAIESLLDSLPSTPSGRCSLGRSFQNAVESIVLNILDGSMYDAHERINEHILAVVAAKMIAEPERIPVEVPALIPDSQTFVRRYGDSTLYGPFDDAGKAHDWMTASGYAGDILRSTLPEPATTPATDPAQTHVA